MITSTWGGTILFSRKAHLQLKLKMMLNSIVKIHVYLSDQQDLDMLHKNESDDNQDTIETLQSSLQDEIQKRQNAEEDMKRYIQVKNF